MSGSFVQSAINAGTGVVSSASLAYPSNNTSSNQLVVSVFWIDVTNVGVPAVSGNGNAYVQEGTATQNTRKSACFLVTSCAAGANTVQFTWSGTVNDVRITISEHSGVPFFDLSLATPGANVSNASTTSFTPAAAGETVIVHGWTLFNATGAGAGYVLRSGGALNSRVMVEDRLSASAGPQTATFPLNPLTCCCSPVPTDFIVNAIVLSSNPIGPSNDAIFFNHV